MKSRSISVILVDSDMEKKMLVLSLLLQQIVSIKVGTFQKMFCNAFQKLIGFADASQEIWSLVVLADCFTVLPGMQDSFHVIAACAFLTPA